MLVVCERWVGDGDRLLHIDTSSSDHSRTSFSSWLGLLNHGSLRAQSSLSAAGSQFGILSPNDTNCNWLKSSVSWLYFCLMPTCFRCSSAYLHRCISWLMARSRVNMLQFPAFSHDNECPFDVNTFPQFLKPALAVVNFDMSPVNHTSTHVWHMVTGLIILIISLMPAVTNRGWPVTSSKGMNPIILPPTMGK